MKKYFIAVAALGLLAACHGNRTTQNDVPMEVEEETYAVAEAVPDQPAMPIMPAMKEKPARPINMRDSLKVDPKKGAVIQKRYKGTMPVQGGQDVAYDLTLYYQQDDTNDGVYEMDAIYAQENDGNGKTYVSTGKSKKKTGTPKDSNATVYALIPSDGSQIIYFLVDGNTLTMLDEQLEQYPGGTSCVLTEVQ